MVKINKSVKILVGVGTSWIIIYAILFLAVVSGLMFDRNPEKTLVFLKSFFPVIALVHFFTMTIQVALAAFFLYHVIKNGAASEILRVILGIGIFFLPYIAMPVYYYLYIWREQPPKWALERDKN
jgi:hypothetical protein